jgi:type IV pilus assembly protein PilW
MHTRFGTKGGGARRGADVLPRHQGGLTLVELLVALVISLLLLAGLVTVFAAMNSSFSTTKQLNHLVGQQRLASTVLTNTVESAGYWPVANRDIRGQFHNAMKAFPAAAPDVHIPLNFTKGQFIYATGAATSSSPNVIAIRMMTGPDNSVFDCQGGTNASGDIEHVINVFWVDTTKNELKCAVSVNGDAPTTVPLLGGDRLPVKGEKYGGVKSLFAVYGVDTDASGSVDRYMSAETLNSGGGEICPDVDTNTGNTNTCWPYVRSVRLTIGFVTALDPRKTQYVARNIVLANAIGRNIVAGGGMTMPPPAASGGD